MASTRDSDKRKIAEKQIFVKYLKFSYVSSGCAPASAVKLHLSGLTANSGASFSCLLWTYRFLLGFLPAEISGNWS
jgi:hypothetical protein